MKPKIYSKDSVLSPTTVGRKNPNIRRKETNWKSEKEYENNLRALKSTVR